MIDEVTDEDAAATPGQHQHSRYIGVRTYAHHLVEGLLIASQHASVMVGQHHDIPVTLGDTFCQAITTFVQCDNQYLISDTQLAVGTNITLKFHISFHLIP